MAEAQQPFEDLWQEVDEEQPGVTRRHLFQVVAGLGIGTTVFQRAVTAKALQAKKITTEMIEEAEWIAGLELTEQERKRLARSMSDTMQDLRRMQAVNLTNDVPPALYFNPIPGQKPPESGRRGEVTPAKNDTVKRPPSDEDLAFLTVTELAGLIRDRKISSVELTKLYLARLKKYDPILKCVVNFAEDVALEQAKRADGEIAAGRYLGALHGIPWGAKDLIAYPGTKTTWGAPQFKDQVLDVKATVAKRLEDAGAVLLAKLSLGSLAYGDQWFGGQTKNPWNPRFGSSGSSAGSACTTAAGLVGFALGSETLGSIVSPSRRCGTSGLRPTFGRVSRYGCMSLSWSMDKIGPIARSIEDCALVFGAIHGWDGLDPTAADHPFTWPSKRNLREIRVGYVDNGQPTNKREELGVLKDLGVKLVDVKLPKNVPLQPLQLILSTEAATAFEDLTRKGDFEGLERWKPSFQEGQFIPAVAYLRANRIRTLLMQEMEKVMKTVDLYVGGNDLLITNLTGHPTIVMPNGLFKLVGRDQPSSITFTGRLYGEAELLAVGHAYQQATGHHLKHPDMKKLEEQKEND